MLPFGHRLHEASVCTKQYFIATCVPCQKIVSPSQQEHEFNHSPAGTLVARTFLFARLCFARICFARALFARFSVCTDCSSYDSFLHTNLSRTKFLCTVFISHGPFFARIFVRTNCFRTAKVSARSAKVVSSGPATLKLDRNPFRMPRTWHTHKMPLTHMQQKCFPSLADTGGRSPRQPARGSIFFVGAVFANVIREFFARGIFVLLELFSRFFSQVVFRVFCFGLRCGEFF